jgi:hypothetical protein
VAATTQVRLLVRSLFRELRWPTMHSVMGIAVSRQSHFLSRARQPRGKPIEHGVIWATSLMLLRLYGPPRNPPSPCVWVATARPKKRRGGGIEPLHVSMPRELKSRPSTSPTHPGQQRYRNVAVASLRLCGHVAAIEKANANVCLCLSPPCDVAPWLWVRSYVSE